MSMPPEPVTEDPGATITLRDPTPNGGPPPPANQPPANQPPPPTPPGYYSEEQVRERLNQARTEEREKLYGARSQEQQELADLRAWRQEQERLRQEHEAEQQRQAEEQRRQTEQEELSSKDLIARREAELRAEMDEQRAYFDAELARERALREKEAELTQLLTYRERAIAANAEHILPELADYISGTTQQEIDASIQQAIERTQSVLQNFRSVGQEQLRQAPGVSTRSPAVGPEAMLGGTRSFSAEEIADWSMADYMKYRSQLPPGRAGSSDRGLF
jgi:hypothetical protein